MDVALTLEDPQGDLMSVLSEYGILPQDFSRVAKLPSFAKEVERLRTEVREQGLGFKIKTRIMAEALLPRVNQMIHDVDTSPAVQADLIKSVVKWGGLEPKDTGNNTRQNNSVSITINLGGDDIRVIDGGTQ